MKRPGTENVAGIVVLATACQLAQTRLKTEPQRLRTLRDRLWQNLSGRIPALF